MDMRLWDLDFRRLRRGGGLQDSDLSTQSWTLGHGLQDSDFKLYFDTATL